MADFEQRSSTRCVLLLAFVVILVSACSGDGRSPVAPTLPVSAPSPVATTQPTNPATANLVISFAPDPILGSRTPCTGAFWAGQTPTWSDIETLKETQGVGFTLKMLTYNFYNQEGVLILTTSFQDNHYFPPYDEHVEDGCMALRGSPSGSFEEILRGVDDNGHQLSFTSRVQLLPVKE